MSEWSSRPRQTPFAGHRKATHRWCDYCQALHRTHRHSQGEERCPAVLEAKARKRAVLDAGPAILSPKPGQARVNMAPLGRG